MDPLRIGAVIPFVDLPDQFVAACVQQGLVIGPAGRQPVLMHRLDHTVQAVVQFGKFHRFCQVIPGPIAQGSAGVFEILKASQKGKLAIDLVFIDVFQYLDAVHLGHLDVAHHQLGPLFFYDLNGGFSVVGPQKRGNTQFLQVQLALDDVNGGNIVVANKKFHGSSSSIGTKISARAPPVSRLESRSRSRRW